MNKWPLISIVIANYNGKLLLKECLDSISALAYLKNKLEVIVVDNCSTDSSYEFIKNNYKTVKIIKNKINNYCQACNLGIDNSKGDYIVLLNNDVRVAKDWLSELVKVMEKDNLIGASTSKLLKEDGSIQNVGLYELPNFYWGERGAGRSSKEYCLIEEIQAFSGACVMYRRDALKQVGFLDEDFIMFGEDVDISIKLRDRGWKLVYVPSSIGYHRVHGSCDEAFACEAIEKNRLLLIAKHFPDKLSTALLGQGYFTVNEKNKKSGQFFDLLPALFLKLVKEHKSEIAYKAIREIFIELKRVVNYDNKKLEEDLKSIFTDWVETKKDRDCIKNDKERLIGELGSTRQELNSYKGEISNLADKLKESLDAGLVKDNKITELCRDKEEVGNKLRDSEEEAANLADKLRQNMELRLKTENELLNIYNSRGFKFILRPLWQILVPTKLFLKYAIKIIYDFLWGLLAIGATPLVIFQAFLFILERAIEPIFIKVGAPFRKKRRVPNFNQLTVSIVIPNWNGIDLLKKCLSSIYDSDGFKDGKHEVLVVDDASGQDIAKSIKEEFPFTRVIRNNTNQGFGRASNRGISQARGELIVLLNNDIMVSADFLNPLKEHFKDPNVFSVSPKLYYWDKKTFNYGMHMGEFKNGYLSLWNESETGNGGRVSQTAPTIFAIGATAVFRKSDFLWLGGFDDIYRPNCWEDIDISYRAQKRGLKVLYEPKSVVYHKGAATLNYARRKEIKNELLFMWKNLTDTKMLFNHVANLPRFLCRGRHSSRLTFLAGYLWGLCYFIPALINRLRESRYIEVKDKAILNKCLLYYSNLKQNNYTYPDKKTILLITPFLTYPLDCGGRLRVYNLYKRLSTRYDLILLSLIHNIDENKHIPRLKEIFKEVYTVGTKTAANDFFFPRQYKYSFSALFIDKLKEIQEKTPVDLVHIESNEILYLTKYIKYAPIVYTEHDISILSLSNSYYKNGPFVTWSGFLDYFKLVYLHNQAYKNIDYVITLSKEDEKIIQAFAPGAKYSLIPTGVDLEHFCFTQKAPADKYLIFVGHYPHYPNEEAVVYFCRQIFPLVKKAIPGITVKLVGSSPTLEVTKLAEIEGVKVIGEVSDVNPYLQGASCFVTAFKRSAGIKGKVLEAMAAGIPVVSTRSGACGIDAVGGRDIFIADNPKEFASRVIELIRNEVLYKSIALAARRLVEDKYGWEEITKKLDHVYRYLVGDENCSSNNPYLPVEKPVDNNDRNAGSEIIDSVKQNLSIPRFSYDEHTGTNPLVDDIVAKVNNVVGLSLKYLEKDKKTHSIRKVEELHLELTHSCNSRCITCDIWDYHQRNNKSVADEISLDEIKNLVNGSKHLKDIKTVVLSGGEPFLRDDLVDICSLIKKALPKASLGILTNGLDTENILTKTKDILRICGNNLWIGSSLDGLGDYYNKIRGVNNGFMQLINTIERFKEELPQIKFSLTFVLTPLNIEQLISCWEFAESYNLDFFAQFAVAKEARSEKLFGWNSVELKRIKDLSRQIISGFLAKNEMLADPSRVLSDVGDKINLFTKIYYWSHLVDFQERPKRCFSKCDAGSKFAMFDPYGSLFFCPILKNKTVGNIRQDNFDDLWSSGQADKVRGFIDSGNCSCWLVCTVFPAVDKALTLYAQKAVLDLKDEVFAIEATSKDKNTRDDNLNQAEFREKKIILQSFPEGVTIGSSYKCNSDCMFCLGGEYRPFSLKLYKDFFEAHLGNFLAKASHVSFCGMGELLLTPDINSFLDHININLASKNKILTTNGLALSKDIAHRLIVSRYSLQISLHASNSLLHSHITGMERGFGDIIRNIKYIVSKRKDKQSPHIALVFLINTLNIEDLPDFIDLAASLGIDGVQCNYLTIFKQAHLKLSCFFKQAISNEMLDKAKQRAAELKVSLSLPPKFSQNNGSYFRSACNQPWKNIYIDTEGAVLPCCFSGEHFGGLGVEDILSIWNNEKYQQLRKGLISGNAIKMCQFCPNNDPANVNLLESHVSDRPEVQQEILGKDKKIYLNK